MPRILILCTGNSARSQMAEAVLKSYDPTLEVFSAGTRPAPEVHPCAKQAMEEIGLDISEARPKSVDEFLGLPFDFVITVCADADASCPAFLGSVRRRMHIGFDDPAAAQGSQEAVMEEFRRVRDQIAIRFREFYLDEIRAAQPKLRPARASDLAAVKRLLAACQLCDAGLESQFPDGYAVTEAAGELVASAGIEVYGEDGLLRSVAVAEAHRNSGLGDALVLNRLQWAAKRSLRAIYLLTLTAPDYFAHRGFWQVDRDSVPEPLRASAEFQGACPATAIVMCLTLR